MSEMNHQIMRPGHRRGVFAFGASMNQRDAATWALGAVIVLLVLILAGWFSYEANSAEAHLRVIDGDTVAQGRVRVRLVGLDAPETFDAKCPGERDLGLRAKARLVELTSSPHVATLKWEKGRDKYGRGLARLYSDHRDVAPVLISEGLARAYDGHSKRQGWCQ